jgi:hypothetical protein
MNPGWLGQILPVLGKEPLLMGKKYKDPPLIEDLPEFRFNQDSQIERLKEIYGFRGKEEVNNFIKANPQIEEILIEASGEINRYFPDSQPILKHFSDPETTGEQHLIISIPTIYSPKETLTRLDQLEDEWWVENVYRAEGKVSINVEFK